MTGKNDALGWMASLVFIQFFTRIFHFGLSLLLLRFLSPQDLGRTALQIPFITMIFTRIAKEALHRAAIKEQEESEREGKKGSNMILLWWSIPLCIISSSVVTLLFIFNSSAVEENRWMIIGLSCWLVSSWLELAIEPVLVFTESHMLKGITVGVEFSSLVLHGICTAFLLWRGETVLVQSYGQLIFALSSFIGYWGYARFVNIQVWNSVIPSSMTVEWEMIERVKGFLYNSIGKYVTAEGERAILFAGGNAEQQGLYEFVNNMGSIIARIAFLPIEKTAYVEFSRWKDVMEEKENVTRKKERLRNWEIFLGISFIISFAYLSTCFNYVQTVLFLISGAKWSESEAPLLLGCFGFYLLLIGINGLVESLRDAIAPNEKIAEQAKYSTIFIVTYFVQGYFLMQWYGAGGLLLASCFSVIQRCAFNYYFFGDVLFPITKGLPTWDGILVFVTIFITGAIAKSFFGNGFKLLFVGVVSGVFFLLWLALYSQYKGIIVNLIKKGRSNKKTE
eukprot:TRINITY_DN8264_c0_g1_i1.p1 TRINITY_DN8264_c0_g1~~TRINITY_DN8264_c0_g1_i1.p1  ORF type:complete len:507 (-),score=165.87 TRINITY_DN8264_c0_g1_i1:193-1713(-)